MRSVRAIIGLVFLMAGWAACKEPFTPKLNSTSTNTLVVEGFINASGHTIITLRRTVPLNDSTKIKAEENAQVAIIAEDNSTYNVKEVGNGTYTSDILTLSTNQKYRLHIKTVGGGEYLSEYVAVNVTPPIDDVSKTVAADGLQINISTHDPQNKTKYYKWDYEETWEIHSAFANYVKYANGGVSGRSPDEVVKLYYCWVSQNSSSILIASSEKLANDVINLAPIVFIPNESEKTSVRYSILIKQYALDRPSYEYFKMMKSNTEALGSIFDPLPSEVTGNITCVSNPLEKVIGYITASTVDQRRIFVTSAEANSHYSMNCGTTYVKNNVDSFKLYYGTLGLLPYQADPAYGPATGYFSSTPICVDCTIRGTNVKPTFW